MKLPAILELAGTSLGKPADHGKLPLIKKADTEKSS